VIRHGHNRRFVPWHRARRLRAATVRTRRVACAPSSSHRRGETAHSSIARFRARSGGGGLGPRSSASAYCFEFDGSSWVQTTKILAPDAQPGDAFGVGLSLSGRDRFVGAPFDDVVCPTNPTCNSGSAYFFELSAGTRQYGSCVDFQASPCGNPDDFGGCVNSTGRGAVLWACGTSSVALDDLLLEARFLPPSAFGIVFMGPAEAQVALGDGLRVAAPGGGVGLYRFPAQQVGPDGRYVLGPGVASMSQVFPGAGAIQPGDSRRFQLWYRDGQGPCGFGTNASSGVRVDFAP
jgi:hypothetical protein